MPECQICYEDKELISLTHSCPHQFCQQCCISHIKQKADRFTPILCAYPQCPEKFTKNKNEALFNTLDEQTKQKINSYIEYLKSLQNPHLKPCSIPNCTGKINMQQKIRKCDLCGEKHCIKCMKKFHEGACIIDAHDQMMREANNQKCPNCQIWVQKKQGCNYIDCKCGTQFCYVCGNPFATDPCRLKKMWEAEQQIRKLFSEIRIAKYNADTKPIDKVKLWVFGVLMLLLKLPLIIIYIILTSILLHIVIICICVVMIGMSPVISCLLLSEGCKECPCFLKILLFPFTIAVIIFLVLFAVLFYPILRNTYHHGIYDGMEASINKLVSIFLQGLVNIFNWCLTNSEQKIEQKPV